MDNAGNRSHEIGLSGRIHRRRFIDLNCSFKQLAGSRADRSDEEVSRTVTDKRCQHTLVFIVGPEYHHRERVIEQRKPQHVIVNCTDYLIKQVRHYSFNDLFR